ncbi:hypothetical protein JCM19239_6577 [Vibrio variabilis]|uniref:Uncharacterized protein n=1 Tax=Vibrio variabilis TaxID=990271 RepID=A0ABQ0JL52_9VIBR|nr:hypothetical protein JCM19239_6577 [Vibrio variabilis]
MKKWLAAAAILSTSFSAMSADSTQCFENKYDAYIDASIQWYEDLVQMTTSEYPELNEVSNWFLEGRKHHFELNREAVRYYLKNEPQKVATEQSIETWLQLEQQDVKAWLKEMMSLDKSLQKVLLTVKLSRTHKTTNYVARLPIY